MSIIDMRPVSRAERRKQQTREQLKRAALTLFFSRGYHGVTIQAITDAADLGYGTFYLHFEHKDAILWEIFYDGAEIYRQAVDVLLADIPFPQREYFAWLSIFYRTNETRSAFADIFGPGGSAFVTQQFHQYVYDLHLYNLEHQVYSMQLDMPHDYMAHFLSGALMRLMVWWVTTPNTYTPEDMTAMFYQAVYRTPPPPVEFNITFPSALG